MDIKVAEDGLYIAEVGSRLIVKLGSRMDMGAYEVKEGSGYDLVLSGKDFAIWEREAWEVGPFSSCGMSFSHSLHGSSAAGHCHLGAGYGALRLPMDCINVQGVGKPASQGFSILG